MLLVRLSLVAALPLAFLGCPAGDEPADPVPPARSQLEVVLDESVAVAVDSGAASPLGMLCVDGDPAAGERWAVDRADDSLVVLPLEHLVSLAPRDSSRLAIRLARTADGLPGDTLVADFRGLPVVIRDAWRFVPATGDTVYVAIASRRLPMESSPLEEQLTLIARPDPVGATRDALAASWFARSAGAEDSLETRDPVLAYRTPGGELGLLMVRDTDGEPVLEMLMRDAGRWTRRWFGPAARCE